MHLPLNLIRKYVPHEIPEAQLATLLNNRVSEVEYHHGAPDPALFADVRIARIESASPIGDEHLRLRLAPAGEEAFEVTVGAGHGLAEGMKVACIRAGGKTPEGMVVDPREVAGTTSGGMLCSEDDLGVGGDKSSVLTFPADLDDGLGIYEALELGEGILEFDLEPHRSDLFSLMGFARDLSVLSGVAVSEPPRADSSSWAALPAETLEVKIENLEKCRRYIGVKLTGLENGPSPIWLQNILRKMGMRPINRIVDVTNYVLAELGQPLHAFDATKLASPVIGVRGAAAGEKVTTLDDNEREVPEGTLLITDGDTPTAIAGIMGGGDSEVGPDTTDIILESATFDMFAVRRASRLLALRTEASLRFEKGLRQPSALRGAERAVLLYQEICGAEVEGWVDAHGEPDAVPTITLRPARVSERLGIDVDTATVTTRLEGLGCTVVADGDELQVTVPDFRPDLNIHEDLEEEVARLGGYENIPETLPVLATKPPAWSDYYRWGPRLRGRLVAHGLSEIHLMSWLGDEEVERYGLDKARIASLKKVLASQWSHFRTCAVPSVARALAENLKTRRDVGIFETGRIYWRRADGETGGGPGPIAEGRRLCGAVTAPAGDDRSEAAYLRARGVVEDLLEHLHVDGAETLWGDAATGLPWQFHTEHFHPMRWVAFKAGETWLGVAGELHPSLAEAESIGGRAAFFDLDLPEVLSRASNDLHYHPQPRFPSVELHANLTGPERLFVGDAVAALKGADEALLADIQVISVYQGDRLAAGTKQVTLSFEFNARERSLRQEEAIEALERLAGTLAGAGLDATLEVPK